MNNKTRNTGTLHTSAKARLTSVVNHSPSLADVAVCRGPVTYGNDVIVAMAILQRRWGRKVGADTTFRISQQWRIQKTIPVSTRWYWSSPKFNLLFIGSLPTLSKNFMQIRSEVFVQSC